jgi:hypothetical protein
MRAKQSLQDSVQAVSWGNQSCLQEHLQGKPGWLLVVQPSHHQLLERVPQCAFVGQLAVKACMRGGFVWVDVPPSDIKNVFLLVAGYKGIWVMHLRLATASPAEQQRITSVVTAVATHDLALLLA